MADSVDLSSVSSVSAASAASSSSSTPAPTRANGAANDWRPISQRRDMFLGACLPARLILAVLIGLGVRYIPKATAIATIVFASAAVATNIFLSVVPGRRWWTPTTSVVLAAAAIAVAIGFLVARDRFNLFALVGLAVASALSGLLHSLWLKPWAADPAAADAQAERT